MASRSPPTLPGKPFVGHLIDFRRDPLKSLERVARIGDIVHFKLGPQDIYLLNHPDYIRDVLVTNNRNFVKSRGLEMAKKFLGESLLTSDGELIDVWQEMMRLTLAVVGKTLFDAEVEEEASEIGQALTEVMRLFERIANPLAGLLNKLPLPSNIRWLRAKARLDQTIYRIINERRASGVDRGDLLSMLLLAQDEEGDGGSMTDVQLRDEALTLFIAGHETTANALTWTWYLLSRNPELEARLHGEIDEVLRGRL